ncbi:hypothetical protein FHS43_002940 [Streptosporangium becharense]|uniref:Uncharacterized protein n=1 Tax=Streptosporangium becharense TaxID=1816182 RepID=A0A7W9ILG2_9ACTN|nr:hypothetical protein [Streptosporangium becharense]MBB2911667.1 hypothetical protein [Streptosporangium becharense]MBB5822515.1 hypothetical protein [Streptosporangium becharense]
MNTDRFSKLPAVIASFVLLPVLLEILAWYIEGEEYDVARAVTVISVIATLALVATVLGRIRARLPVLMVVALTVTAAGEGVLGFVAAFGPVLWDGGVPGEVHGLVTAGVSAFAVATGAYLLFQYSRGLYLPHLDAGASQPPTATKRRVIGESEILIRTMPDIGPSVEKALASCVSMVDQDDLHFVAYYADQRCCFYTDVLDDADLAHFFHDTDQEKRRDLYLKAGSQLNWLTGRLNRQLRQVEGGALIRTVLDVERGALYFYWIDETRYLIGVTLDQRKVGVADDKMAQLVDMIRGHFSLPPLNQRERPSKPGGHLRSVPRGERWPESGS